MVEERWMESRMQGIYKGTQKNKEEGIKYGRGRRRNKPPPSSGLEK
jgi:hypothetical protein